MGIDRRSNVTLSKFLSPALKEAITQSVAEATARADGDLKNGSPVDTGRFRASWFHAQAAGGVPDRSDSLPPAGKGQSYPEPPPLDPKQLDGSKSQLIINNLPYATRLCEEGWSDKVPEDWFKRIGHKWETGGYLDESFERFKPK